MGVIDARQKVYHLTQAIKGLQKASKHLDDLMSWEYDVTLTRLNVVAELKQNLFRDLRDAQRALAKEEKDD